MICFRVNQYVGLLLLSGSWLLLVVKGNIRICQKKVNANHRTEVAGLGHSLEGVSFP